MIDTNIFFYVLALFEMTLGKLNMNILFLEEINKVILSKTILLFL